MKRENKLTLNIIVMFFLLVLCIAFTTILLNNNIDTAYAATQDAKIDQSIKIVDSLELNNENLYNVSGSNNSMESCNIWSFMLLCKWNVIYAR